MKPQGVQIIGIFVIVFLLLSNMTFALTVIFGAYMYFIFKKNIQVLIENSIFVMVIVSLHLIFSTIGLLLTGMTPGDDLLFFSYHLFMTFTVLLLSVYFHRKKKK